MNNVSCETIYLPFIAFRRLSDPFTVMLLGEIFKFQCPLSTIYSNHTMDIQSGNYTRSVLQVYIYKKGTHGVIGLLFLPIQL